MTFWWIILIPFLILIFSRVVLKTTFSWQELGISFGIVGLLTGLMYTMGTFSAMSDVEILNGQLISKHRYHDTYEDPYDCFCITNSKGVRSCQTCYETRYTVDWYAKTTLGRITIDSLDSSSRSVYSSPNPERYLNIVEGEPVSKHNTYTNYVKAVPESLFSDETTSFNYTVPQYPKVYDYYRIDRVINVDSEIEVSEVNALDSALEESLMLLGPTKEVNVVVILTEIDDQSYRFDVERAWLGGKKNDVVVFIGLDGNNITWTDTMTWALNSGNELFQVKMRDGLMTLGQFNVEGVHNVITQTIENHYDRPSMKDYEYLKDEIEPPAWVIITCFILALLSSIGCVYFFHKNEVNLFDSRRNRW